MNHRISPILKMPFIKRGITAILLLTVFFISFFYAPPIVISLLFTAALTIILLYEWPKLLAVRSWYWWLLTPFYPVLPFLMLIILNQSFAMRFLIPLMIIWVSMFDTGGYFAGNMIGKYKLAPKISPNKTWEGLIGGYILLWLTIIATNWFMGYTWPFNSFVLTLIVGTLACLGDLWVSYFKRKAQLKDTSNLLPGHGGLLDRFDALLFVTYFFYMIIF